MKKIDIFGDDRKIPKLSVNVKVRVKTESLEESIAWNQVFGYIMKKSNVCISLKGVMYGPERELFMKALKVLIDTRSPKALIIYTVASKESSDSILGYAISNGIPIIYIPNTLQIRNCGGIK